MAQSPAPFFIPSGQLDHCGTKRNPPAFTRLANVHPVFCFKQLADKRTKGMRHTGHVLVLTGRISFHIHPISSSDSLNFMLPDTCIRYLASLQASAAGSVCQL